MPPVAFAALLATPLAQNIFGFAPVRGLGGTVAADPEPAPRTLAAWHAGAIQDELEARAVKALGLRDWMVRLDNQLKYWLFGSTKQPVVRGPGDWLVECGYLTARTHATVPVADQIMVAVYGLLLSQQVLAENGITQILLISPSKVETMPEHLPFPHRQVHEAAHPCDIDVLRGALRLVALNQLDAQALFSEWHAKEPDYPLFPRSGTHWSHFAAARVVVSLLDAVERCASLDVPSFDLAEPTLGRSTGPSEDDMLVMANLLDERGMRDPMPIPRLVPRAGDGGQECGVLMVTSSFGWLPMLRLAETSAFTPQTVYYYFRSAFDYTGTTVSEKRPIPEDPAALRAEIARHRIVVVECNVSQIRSLGYGFAQAVVRAFGQPKQPIVLPPAAEIESVRAIATAARRPGR